MHLLIRSSLACLVSIAAAAPAMAYIGPGAGLSLLGAVWGLLAAVVAAIGFIVFWPIRKRRRRRRMLREAKARHSAGTAQPAQHAAEPAQLASAAPETQRRVA